MVNAEQSKPQCAMAAVFVFRIVVVFETAMRLGSVRRRLSVAICGVAVLVGVSFLSMEARAELPAGSVEAALIMDVASGEILEGRGVETLIPPASLAKIMTIHLAYEALAEGRASLEEPIVTPAAATRVGGATLGLQQGETLTLRQAVEAVAVWSANDAAVALAAHLAGDEAAFVARMNETAISIGMTATTYRNAHGMPAQGQVTTALDTARLAREHILRHPEALAVHSLRTFTFRNKTYENRNTLLDKYPGVDGLKTGYIKDSGHCLVATAQRGVRRVLTVVLGAPGVATRDAVSRDLLSLGLARLRSMHTP